MPALIGEFQLHNAACVISAIESLQQRLFVNPDAIHQGLKSVNLHGRYQYLSVQPDIILDVAHNPHAAKSLAINLQNTRPTGKTIAVFAMLADKDIAGVVKAIACEIDVWYVAGIQNARGADASIIKSFVNAELPNSIIQLFNHVENAFHQACIDANENDRIIVVGSFLR